MNWFEEWDENLEYANMVGEKQTREKDGKWFYFGLISFAYFFFSDNIGVFWIFMSFFFIDMTVISVTIFLTYSYLI